MRRRESPRARRRKWFYLVLGLLPLLLPLFLFEAAGRIVLLLWPTYDVLFLEPDRAVGWKQVPNLEWTWAGVHWYANDYSVRIKTNSLGFRDREREFSKPDGVVRVALLGDSFVEAIQVPLEKTAGQLLEARLNARGRPPAYEVLNFGISNYGVGQYLLAWEEYSSKFDADLVFILVAGFHLQRTITKAEIGRFHHTSSRALWIRPTFRLQGDSLIREPAADYAAFLAAQRELIEREFDGGRSRRRETSLIGHFAKQWWARGAAMAAPVPAQVAGFQSMVDVNLRVVEELAGQVKTRAARLILADASAYFGDPRGLSGTLRRFCNQHGVGYIPFGERLRAANRAGRATRWAHDGHFNEAGNEIFADAMFGWMAKNVIGER